MFFQPPKKEQRALRRREKVNNFGSVPPDFRPLNGLFQCQRRRKSVRVRYDVNKLRQNLWRKGKSISSFHKFLKLGASNSMFIVGTDFNRDEKRRIETVSHFNISPRRSSRL